MNKQELLLAAMMLSIASMKCSNHGCNDLSDETLGLITDKPKLCSDYRKWVGDEGFPERVEQIPDWGLMRYLRDKLINQALAPPPPHKNA